MYEYVISQVSRIIDGDTIDVIIDVGFSIYRKERIRLNRLDTPEGNSKNEIERSLAIDAKDFVTSWLFSQKQLKIKTIKDDKYGRILGEIYGDSECLNDILLESGYAWEYHGDAKSKDVSLLLEKRKIKK